MTTSISKKYVANAINEPMHTGSEDSMSYFMMPSMDVFDESVNTQTKILVKVRESFIIMKIVNSKLNQRFDIPYR